MELDILNLLLVLLCAWLGGGLATRLGYPSILGELMAGILLGPSLLGFLEYNQTVAVLAELGVFLMMLFIGMEIDYRELGRASWAGLLAAIGGFIVPFALGYYAIIAFGGSGKAALFTAIAVGVTSLATKSRILVDLKLLNTRIANVLMAGALISDTLALLIFAGIMGFAEVGNIDLKDVGLVGGKALLFFGVSTLIGLYLLPWLARWIERLGLVNRTLYFTVMLAFGLLFAEMAELAGLHHILGAFIAGLFLKDTFPGRKLNKHISDTFHDISIGFLAPVFFVTAGFQVSFSVVYEEPVKLLVILALATLGKILGTALFYLPSGNGWREGVAVGAGMNGRGAVEIIIAGIGLKAGYLDSTLFSILVFMAIFTTATVPVLLRITTQWLRRRNELVMSTSGRKGYLFLGGGPLTELLATELSSHEDITVIDSNKDNCRRLEKAGIRAIHGNAMSVEVLTDAGAAATRRFICMTANSEINVLAAQLAYENFGVPGIHVVISPTGEDALIRLIDANNASTLFGMRLDIDQWEYKIQRQEYARKTVTVTERKTIRELVKYLRETEQMDCLILYYEDGNGKLHLSHYHAVVERGYNIHYLV